MDSGQRQTKSKMNDRKRILRYICLDYLSALIAWQLFNVFRFYEFRSTIDFASAWDFLNNPKAYTMSLTLPVLWVLLYAFLGYYHQPRRKTSSSDLLSTLFSTLVGSLLIFFMVIINDYPAEYTQFYSVLAGLLLIHFFCTLLLRLIQTLSMLNGHAAGKVGVSALVIGCGQEAEDIRRYLSRRKNSSPYLAQGFVKTAPEDRVLVQGPVLGTLDDLDQIIARRQTESLIIASDQRDDAYIRHLTDRLYAYGLEIQTTMHPQEVLLSDVSLYSVSGVPLRRLTPAGMSVAELHLKRTADLLISILGLTLLSPLFLYLALRVRRDSPGPVLYRQERLGKNARPFNIIKFRTMYTDAEADGPLLSTLNDNRVTPFGRLMRKYRLDELPQLYNVLKGEMSLVGPRPEREFYARQIISQAPHYQLVWQVKPGLTSMGEVKYGYADTIGKMIERLDYDIIYLKNQSLLMDLTILVSTVKPILLGKGI